MLLVLAFSLSTAYAQVQFLSDFVPFNGKAIGLTPPEVVCGPKVLRTVWSPDGSRLLIIRAVIKIDKSFLKQVGQGIAPDPPDSGEFLVWDSVNSRSHSVFNFDPRITTFGEVRWIVGKSALLASFSYKLPSGSLRHEIVYIPTDGGSSSVVRDDDPKDGGLLAVSPTHPVVALLNVKDVQGKSDFTMTIMDGDGNLGQSSHLLIERASTSFMDFDQSGQVPVVNVSIGPSGHGVLRQFQYNAGGEMTEVAHPIIAPPLNNIPKGLPFKTEPISKSTGPLARKAIWLTTTAKAPDRLLVTPDGESPNLAPFGTGVSFTQEGWLIVRRCISIPLEVYAKRLREEDESRARNACTLLGQHLRNLEDLLGQNRIPTRQEWESFAKQARIEPIDPLPSFTYDGSAFTRENAKSITIAICSVKSGTAKLHADWSIDWSPAN